MAAGFDAAESQNKRSGGSTQEGHQQYEEDPQHRHHPHNGEDTKVCALVCGDRLVKRWGHRREAAHRHRRPLVRAVSIAASTVAAASCWPG